MRNRATTGDVVPEAQVAGTGFQRRPFPLGNSHIEPTSAAKSGASDAANQVVDAELNEVISIWPLLSPDLRQAILTIVRAGRGQWIASLRTVTQRRTASQITAPAPPAARVRVRLLATHRFGSL